MIVYKLRDPDRAPALASAFETLFQHEAQSWQDREEANLQLFLTLRISAAITVSLIILLAGFGIFNVLTMSVLSKIKEIAILRSMGYRPRHQCDFPLAGSDDRGLARSSDASWCVPGPGRIAYPNSRPRLDLRESLSRSPGIGGIISGPRCSPSSRSSSPAMSPRVAPALLARRHAPRLERIKTPIPAGECSRADAHGA